MSIDVVEVTKIVGRGGEDWRHGEEGVKVVEIRVIVKIGRAHV